MLGNGFEMSFIFHRILGPFVLGWTPNHLVLGAQLAPGEKRLVYVSVIHNLQLDSQYFFFILGKVWFIVQQRANMTSSMNCCYIYGGKNKKCREYLYM